MFLEQTARRTRERGREGKRERGKRERGKEKRIFEKRIIVQAHGKAFGPVLQEI